MKFLKVALPDGVLCQPPVIQFQRFSTISRVLALIEGGLLITKMAYGCLFEGLQIY